MGQTQKEGRRLAQRPERGPQSGATSLPAGAPFWLDMGTERHQSGGLVLSSFAYTLTPRGRFLGAPPLC